MIRNLSVAAAVALLCAMTPAQHIWRVNCAGGPNVDYTDLPPAVAAAAPGDTILVYYDTLVCPGQMQGYSATIVDKPLRIVGFHVQGAGSGNQPTNAGVYGLLTIQNIQAGSRVVISNIFVHPDYYSAFPPSQHGILVQNCLGEVLLEGVGYEGSDYANCILRFDNCANVTLRGCRFRMSGSPLTFIDSTALLTTTETQWIVSPLSLSLVWPYHFAATTEGLRVRNSDVTLIGSVIRGANHVNYNPQASWGARVGAVVESGTLRIGPATLLIGGYSPNASPPNFDSYSLNPALAQVLYDARALPLTYPYWNPLPYTPATIHAAYHDWVVGGESYSVSVVGPPNGFGALLVGSAAIQPLNVGIGLLAVDPLGAQVLGLKPLNAVGHADWIPHCPSVVPVGHAFAFQGAVLSPTGVLSLTVPSPFAVGWPHGQIP